MKASQNSGRKSLGEIEKSNHLTASTGDTCASWGLAAQILDGFYVAGGSPECARPGDLQIHRRRSRVSKATVRMSNFDVCRRCSGRLFTPQRRVYRALWPHRGATRPPGALRCISAMVWVSCPRRCSRGSREEQGDAILYLLQLASGAARSATDLASARSADVPGGFLAAIVDDQRRGLQFAVPAPISSDQPAS